MLRENAAIWVDDREIKHRVAWFITQHLGILLAADAIVNNLHEAYEQLDFNEQQFGVFISGPSKTAEIRTVAGYRRAWTTISYSLSAGERIMKPLHLLFLALLLILPSQLLVAGGGPENVLVVVNAPQLGIEDYCQRICAPAADSARQCGLPERCADT